MSCSGGVTFASRASFHPLATLSLPSLRPFYRVVHQATALISCQEEEQHLIRFVESAWNSHYSRKLAQSKVRSFCPALKARWRGESSFLEVRKIRLYHPPFHVQS